MYAGLLGGVISIIAMSFAFDGSESSLLKISLCMLCAVFFFAVAGGFRSGGPWNGELLLLMTFICAGTVIASYILGALTLFFTVVLVILAVVMILVGACPKTKRWIISDRN